MTPVECDRIARHKAAHDLAQRGLAGAEQEVKMVWNQGPCVTLGLSFLQNGG